MMHDRLDKIRRYYDTFDEWSRLDTPAGQIEFLRTLEVLNDHLPPACRVLDLGGGPGRYTIELARAGHRVSLADVSAKLLQAAKQRVQAAGVANRVESINLISATDLGIYDADSFDAVVALGPFYHLTLEAERSAAANEVARVLRPRGVLIASFIPRLSGLSGLIARAAADPEQAPLEVVDRVAAEGVFQNASDRGFQEGYYPHVAQVVALFESCGFTQVALLSVRGFASGYEEHLLRLRERQPQLFDRFMRLIGKTAGEPGALGLGGHALFVGRKQAAVAEA